MIKAKYFPTIIYAKDVDLDNRLFENAVIEWSQKDKGIQRTNMKGWHSETDMHKIPVFEPLVNELFKMQNEIFKEEFLDSEPILGNMWANINPPGGYNRPHLHPNCHFSGVYYIKAPENSGQIIFNDPKTTSHMVMPNRIKTKPSPDLWREVRVNPVVGRIIIFPAWLWHCVEPNESNDIRISVSFNFLQKGFNV
jgi:uncharacterized protein (TIGR02466 family)|tara:strand:- start:110 stop:694 length:585 start_codon:yes stop_codon:yes gene_type:complete